MKQRKFIWSWEFCLLSTTYFALAKHITVFDGDEVNMYDANDIKKNGHKRRNVTRLVNVGRKILANTIVKNVTSTLNFNTTTCIANASPVNLLKYFLPPLPESINSVCSLKTKPELICGCHAAEGWQLPAISTCSRKA